MNKIWLNSGQELQNKQFIAHQLWTRYSSRQMFSPWRMLVYNRNCQRIVVQGKKKTWKFLWFSPPPNLHVFPPTAFSLRAGSAEPIGFCWFVAIHFWRICLFMRWLQKHPQTAGVIDRFMAPVLARKNLLLLLMVQKSQTTTWDVQNPANNGINYLYIVDFCSWTERSPHVIGTMSMSQQSIDIFALTS